MRVLFKNRQKELAGLKAIVGEFGPVFVSKCSCGIVSAALLAAEVPPRTWALNFMPITFSQWQMAARQLSKIFRPFAASAI